MANCPPLYSQSNLLNCSSAFLISFTAGLNIDIPNGESISILFAIGTLKYPNNDLSTGLIVTGSSLIPLHLDIEDNGTSCPKSCSLSSSSAFTISALKALFSTTKNAFPVKMSDVLF